VRASDRKSIESGSKACSRPASTWRRKSN
jgi:hypothetical protein